MAGSLSDTDRQFLQGIIDHSFSYTPETVQSAKKILQANDFTFFNRFHPKKSLSVLPPAGNAFHYADQFREVSSNEYHGVIHTPKPPAPPPPAPKPPASAPLPPTPKPGPGFVLHKKNGSKYEGLDEIVAEATQQTAAPSWGDIGAEVGEGGHIVGGASSYYEEPLPSTGSVKKKRTVVTRLGAADQKNILEWKALQDKWQHSLSIQNAQATRMSDAAAVIATNQRWSQRLRLGAKLGSFATVQEREDYLDAVHVDSASARRELLALGEIEYARRSGKPVSHIKPTQYFSLGLGNNASGAIGMRLGSVSGSGWQQNSFLYDLALGNKPYAQYELPEHLEERMFMGVRTKVPVSGDALGFNWDGFAGYSKVDDLRAHGVKRFDWAKLFETFGKGLTTVSTAFKTTAPIFQALSDVNHSWKAATFQEVSGAYNAAEYFVPRVLKGATGRLFNSVMQSWGGDWEREIYNRRATSQGLLGAAGILGGIATLNPALIAGGIAGSIESYGSWRTGQIKATGQSIQSRINLWSGVSELVLAPIKLTGEALKWLTSHLKLFGTRLGVIISQFSQLGLPLTALTGMSYSSMQRSYVADALIGASAGTTARGVEAFSYAQQNLYTFGQLDTNRTIAAAMLGSFGDIYAQGGNTQRQYASVLNRAYAQARSNPAERQRIMNLLRVVDETMPARLQQMLNLGGRFGDYNYLSSGKWAGDYGITLYSLTQAQRNRMSLASIQYTGLKDSILSSRNILAERLWSGYGKNLMSGFNDIFANFARGDINLPSALSQGWGMLQNTWKQLSSDFNFPDVGQKIKGQLISLIPEVARIMGVLGNIIIQGWGEIGGAMADALNKPLTHLSLTRMKFDRKKLMSGKWTSLADIIQVESPDQFKETWQAPPDSYLLNSYVQTRPDPSDPEGNEQLYYVNSILVGDKAFKSKSDALAVARGLQEAQAYLGIKEYGSAENRKKMLQYLSMRDPTMWSEEIGLLYGTGDALRSASKVIGAEAQRFTTEFGDNLTEQLMKGFDLNITITDSRTGERKTFTVGPDGSTPLSALGFDFNDLMVKISAGKGE